jgi:phage terminase small subunit
MNTKRAGKGGAAQQPKGRKTTPPPKKGLNLRQLRFIDEYLVDMNAAQAAVRAGYSKKAAKELGYRLLTNAHIAAAIEVKRKELAPGTGITRERILREIEQPGFDALAAALSKITGVPA